MTDQPSPVKILLADDHPLLLEALAGLFQEPEFQIVASCTDGSRALECLTALQPDVGILDLKMPKMSGLDVVRAARAHHVRTRLVLLTAEAEDSEIVEALRYDISGIVLKEMAPRLLLQCVRTVASGQKWMEHDSLRRAMDALLRDPGANSERLTPREAEIVRLVTQGMRNKEIARAISITEGTVKMHLHNIYEKLGVGSRLELASYARQKRLVRD